MSLDPKIKDAIAQAVESSGQSPALAQRIAAWVEGIIVGDDDLNDPASAELHLDLLYDEVRLDDEGGRLL